MAITEGAQADLDLRRFLFLIWEKVLFASLADFLFCRLLVFLDDLDVIGEYSWGRPFWLTSVLAWLRPREAQLALQDSHHSYRYVLINIFQLF